MLQDPLRQPLQGVARLAASLKTAVGCLTLFTAPFAAASLFAAFWSVRSFVAGDWKQGGLLAFVAVTFGLVPAYLLGMTARGYPIAKRIEQLKQAHPGEPWLWREDWASGRITSPAGASLTTTWFLAVIWNLVSAPLLVIVPREFFDKGNSLALIGLLFPVVGAGLLVWAGRETIRLRKFGASVFQMAAVPAPLGGRLAGALQTSVALRPEHGVKIRLSCIRRTTSGSGRSQTTWENVLWQDEQTVTTGLAPVPSGGSAVPLSFALPVEAPPTNADNPSDRILWRLEGWAEVPGVDYGAQFEVPVFRTNQAAEPRPPAPSEAVAARPEHPTIRVSLGPRGGTEFVFPAARNIGPALGFTAFLAIWTGSIWLMVRLGAPVFFPVVFSAFGLLLFALGLDVWLLSARVLIEGGTVTIRSGILGIARTRRIPSSDISDVRLAIGMQSGGTAFYDVKLVLSGGRAITVGQNIRDKHEAEWVAAEMKRRIKESR